MPDSSKIFWIAGLAGFISGCIACIYVQPKIWYLCFLFFCYLIIQDLFSKKKEDKCTATDLQKQKNKYRKIGNKINYLKYDCNSNQNEQCFYSDHIYRKRVKTAQDENQQKIGEEGKQKKYSKDDMNSDESVCGRASRSEDDDGGSSSDLSEDEEEDEEFTQKQVAYLTPRLNQVTQQQEKLSSQGTGDVGWVVPLAPLVTYHSHDPFQKQMYSAKIPKNPSIENMRNLMLYGERIEEAAAQDELCRITIHEDPVPQEAEDICEKLLECQKLRTKWLFKPKVSAQQMSSCKEAEYPKDIAPIPSEYIELPRLNYHYEMQKGVVHVYRDNTCKKLLFAPIGDARSFFSDMHQLLKVQDSGPVKTFTQHRLKFLEKKFDIHVMVNAEKEFLAQKSAPHRDFYNVRKVDTHIHHTACMHQKHLLRFMKAKLRAEPDEIVLFRDGKYLTLREVFESLNLTSYDLNVDTLDMHVDKKTFHRFDRFNSKYNPCGQSRLREVFLKNDNVLHGRYIGELTKEVLKDLESNKYQHTEFRISINGRKKVEWDMLAQWIKQYNLYSNNNVWLIQIPRLYSVYYSQGLIENFQQMLDNIFLPLFEVTLDPSTHPNLHVFLQNVVGFDTVDDESKPERRPTKTNALPEDWDHGHNPAYSYYTYYIYSNLYVLNKVRESRGLNTFAYRPHCGESGDIDHLSSAFLVAENISHGINLRYSSCLQYLYYIEQIGICMSPLSNNSLFLDYHRNPFPSFFAKGLSVSLSSDDPLQIHLTREPLVEEYSVAAQLWKLTSADLCEIARNSVLHSGYPHACKMHWVGEEYWKLGTAGNDIKKTNVPNLRIRYRFDTLSNEVRMLHQGAQTYHRRLLYQADQHDHL